MTTALFDTHRETLEGALQAIRTRGFWTPYPEIPSGKFYGETAREDGEAAFEALLNRAFDLPGHPQASSVGSEVSPYGRTLGIAYPAAEPKALVAAAQAAARTWGDATPAERVGVCLEILARLNKSSFLMAHATMHTTGQAFPMAFQAGGPHAQDRGLEAVAYAWAEMTRAPEVAKWEKPQGKGAPIVLEKHWRVIPCGIALAIGCQTFPTWNSYPGIFASLATGNPVIVKPHPNGVLPLALTVRMSRAVLTEAGFDPNVMLLAADEPGSEITCDLVRNPDVAIIDYTGSSSFGAWVRQNAPQARVHTEETGVNSIVLTGTADFRGMCDNIAFSLALYSGQMCTAPQNVFVPRGGIETDEGPKGFEEVADGIAASVDRLLADPTRAASVCGAIANPDTLARVDAARGFGAVVRDSAPVPGLDGARSATPLLLQVERDATESYGEERFGPIAFVVAVADAADGIALAAGLAREKGAITAALYASDERVIGEAADTFARAGVNLSVNLTGGIYVNQSAAFSDFHVTGANPAGNASLTDAAFVNSRFRFVMWRQPMAA